MPYQNDMNSLADIVGPAYAAQQAGIRNDLENQKTQMANQVYQAQMPALEQTPGLENLYKQAQTGYESALGQQTQLGNQLKQATMPGEITATNTSNQAKTLENSSAQLSTLGQIVGAFADKLDGVAPPARQAAFTQMIKSAGARDDQIPLLMQLTNRGDPETMRALQQHFITTSPQYSLGMGEAQERTKGELGSAALQSQGKVQASANAAQARVLAAQIAKQAKQQVETFEQAAVEAQRRGDNATAQKFYQAAKNIHQQAAMVTGQLVGATPMDPGFVSPEPTPPTPGPNGQPSGQVNNDTSGPTPVQNPDGSYTVGKTMYRKAPDGTWESKQIK